MENKLDDSLLGESPIKRAGTFGGTPHPAGAEPSFGVPTSNSRRQRWTVATPAEAQFQSVEVQAEIRERAAMCGFARQVKLDDASIFKGLQRATTNFFEGDGGKRRYSVGEGKDEGAPVHHGSSKRLTIMPELGEESNIARQTNGEATVNLLNNCLGSGMLAISFAIMKAGLLVGLGLIVFSALLNRFTLLLNLKSCQLAECDPSTAAIGYKAFGTPGRLLMVCMFTCLGFLCLVSYVDATADSLSGVLGLCLGPDKLPGHSSILIGGWAILLVPPTLVRSMKGVALMSFVAFMGGCLMLVAMLIGCTQLLLQNGLPSVENIMWFPADVASFLDALPVLMLVFSIQAGGGVVLATLEDDSEENILQVSKKAYIIVFVMDIAIGVSAYLTFLSNTKGDVIENLPKGSLVTTAAQIALLFLVVLSYMIMIIPCKMSLLDLLFKKNEALQESSALQFYGTTMVLNVLALGLAYAVTDLALVLGLNGAICTNFVAFLMPVAFYLKVAANPEVEDVEPVPVMSPRNIGYHVLFLFGLFSLFLGTYQIALKFV